MDAGVRALYERVAPAMLRFFVSQGVSADTANDVLQDTFIKIVRGAAGFAGNGKASAWVWQVARNCLTDHLRKQQTIGQHESLFDDDAWRIVEATTGQVLPSTSAESVEDCVSAGLRIFSGQMPDRAYALTLQMEGKSVDEIGQQLGRTVGATKEYLSQCRKKIQPFIAHCTDLITA